MTLENYMIEWRPQNDVVHTVNLMIEPELVEKAKWELEPGQETPSRDELCRRVRNAVAVTHSYVRDENIHINYKHLTITLRS